MADPFIGQMVAFGGNFAVRDWAACEGQLLNIVGNSALFSILGTMYGGNGRTEFGLPDLKGRVPIHRGQGAGLPNYLQGQKGGAHQQVLVAGNIPPLPAQVKCKVGEGDETSPANGYPSSATSDVYAETSNNTMNGQMVVANPGSPTTAVATQSPYQAVFWLIALNGIFPSRN